MKKSKDERREEIIQAARMVFVENGYKGATTLQIAKAADISEMTLFRYFSAKELIFKEAIKPLVGSLESTLKSAENKEFNLLLYDLLIDRLQILIKHQDLARLVIMESYFSKNIDFDLILQVKNTISKHFPPYLEEKKELMLRLIVGFILSYIFLPNGETGYKKDLEVFLNQIIYPFIVQGGNSDA